MKSYGGMKMLQVKNIKKEYHTGSLIQKALNGVSLNLRDNEFVAILGPSGSGKTTFLNIIGGLVVMIVVILLLIIFRLRIIRIEIGILIVIIQ